MIEKLRELHGLRNDYRALTERKAALLKAFQVAHAVLWSEVEKAQAQVAALEDSIRAETIRAFQETGNKAPWPGVGIRERSRLDYDPALALNWAREHNIALALDRKLFEQAVKIVALPSFVTAKVDLQATIAQDLGPYVQEPDVQPEGQASSVG